MIPALENAAVNVIDYYLNADATSICVAAEITLPVANATLRVADRFRVDANGCITEQENHFDSRALEAVALCRDAHERPQHVVVRRRCHRQQL
jgi:hypothetical protein